MIKFAVEGKEYEMSPREFVALYGFMLSSAAVDAQRSFPADAYEPPSFDYTYGGTVCPCSSGAIYDFIALRDR
ncbi:MAG: hypothetical protein AAF529_14595 [Pseudomonadota bacterium]